MKKLLIIILTVLFIAGCSNASAEKVTTQQQTKPQAQTQETKKGPELKVHFLDVGQGDCILVQFPGGRTCWSTSGKTTAPIL